MDSLNSVANEPSFSDDEQKAFAVLKAEVATLDAQIVVAEERAATVHGDTTGRAHRPERAGPDPTAIAASRPNPPRQSAGRPQGELREDKRSWSPAPKRL